MFYQKCPRRDHSSHQSTQLSQLRFGIIFFHRSISQPQQCLHLGGITLCGGGCPRPCRMLTASLASIHQTPLAPPPPGWNNQKCLYILPNVRGRGQNTTPHLENDSSRLWILKVWSMDRKQQHLLGGSLEIYNLGPTPDLLRQNLQCDKIPRCFLWTLKSEKAF